jgi:hypothetical protein
MTSTLQSHLEERLAGMVASSTELMAALDAARLLGLQSWCIGAGAVRSLVWDALHGFDRRTAVEDVDLVYFDVDAQPENDLELENQLFSAMPEVRWEVTNQAGVHRWFAHALGQTVPPIKSLADGIATWPEFATCVGVFLNADGTLGIVAPYGLDDLFNLRVRHNPLRASVEAYRARVEAKRFGERWPLLSISMS